MENSEECRVHTLSCDRHFRDRCRMLLRMLSGGEVGGGERAEKLGALEVQGERASEISMTINVPKAEVRKEIESVPGLWGPRP